MSEVLNRPAPPPDHTARYGSHREQVVDLRMPKDGPANGTLVVLIHGGFWRAAYDRTHTGPLADALASSGFAVCTPEYRRTGQPGGGWPGTFDDVAAAMDVLPGRVARELDGVAVMGPVVLAGHSAGGHLALWAAVIRGSISRNTERSSKVPGQPPPKEPTRRYSGTTTV